MKSFWTLERFHHINERYKTNNQGFRKTDFDGTTPWFWTYFWQVRLYWWNHSVVRNGCPTGNIWLCLKSRMLALDYGRFLADAQSAALIVLLMFREIPRWRSGWHSYSGSYGKKRRFAPVYKYWWKFSLRIAASSPKPIKQRVIPMRSEGSLKILAQSLSRKCYFLRSQPFVPCFWSIKTQIRRLPTMKIYLQKDVYRD